MSSGRRTATCVMLGPYKELDDRQLPTIGDVLKYILFIKYNMKLKYDGKYPSNSDIYSIAFE